MTRHEKCPEITPGSDLFIKVVALARAERLGVRRSAGARSGVSYIKNNTP